MCLIGKICGEIMFAVWELYMSMSLKFPIACLHYATACSINQKNTQSDDEEDDSIKLGYLITFPFHPNLIRKSLSIALEFLDLGFPDCKIAI